MAKSQQAALGDATAKNAGHRFSVWCHRFWATFTVVVDALLIVEAVVTLWASGQDIAQVYSQQVDKCSSRSGYASWGNETHQYHFQFVLETGNNKSSCVDQKQEVAKALDDAVPH